MRSTYFLSAVVVCLTVGVSQASVQDIDATVMAEVQEVGATLSDFAFKDLNDTSATLPLTADALLTSDNSETPAGAAARTIFRDPRASIMPNPEEFSLDLAAFSGLAGAAYTGTCKATETRQITFSAEEIGSPDGSTLEASSQFFLDGLVLLWADPGAVDLSSASADFTITIEQTRPGDAEPQNVFSATFIMTGQADGTATMSADGKLSLQNLSIIDLDATTATGAMHLVVMPNLGIPYTYPAVVGETFTLKATVEAHIQSRAGGGAAVALGAPLEDLADELQSLPSVNTDLGSLLQLKVAEAPAPLETLPRASTPTTVRVVDRAGLLFPVCGALSLETAVLSITLLLWTVTARRRTC